MLAHVRDLAPDAGGEVADGDLAVREGLEHAQPLRVRQRAADDGAALVGVLAWWAVPRWPCLAEYCSVCAITQVTSARATASSLYPPAMTAEPPSISPPSWPPARSSPAASIGRRSCRRRPRPRSLARAAGIRVADDRLYLKAEHLQKTGSFKPRGMTARVAALTEDERRRGIITVSAGNAAQGYAYAGAALGVPVTVVMPAAAVRSKAEAAAGYGARVVLEGDVMSETFAALDRIRDEEGLVFCHPFDDRDVDRRPRLGRARDPRGPPRGGRRRRRHRWRRPHLRESPSRSRSCGPTARLYGVEPETSDAISQALAAGHPVRIQPASVADGLNAPFAGELTLPLIRRYVDGVIRIDDATILAGLRFALERMKQVVEPAGAAALAATSTGRSPSARAIGSRSSCRAGTSSVGRLGELIERAAALPA